ncbi:MAG: hypothetical protein ACHQ53_06300 [Polyangiales bacterium]
MSLLHANLWPAGSVLIIALLAIAAMHALERYAHIAVKARTRQALDRVLGASDRE